MIILFGAPGSGKTVQGEMLARKYRWKWASSRDLLMSLNDKDVTMALNHGMPVDDDKNIIVLRRSMLEIERYARDVGWKAAVLDGFPNSVGQIYWMIENGYLEKVDGVIVLQVPRGELWRRILARGRVDDTRAAYERRQDMYERTVAGMLHVFKENNIPISNVDGQNAPEDVFLRIEEKLGEWGLVPKKNFEKIS